MKKINIKPYSLKAEPIKERDLLKGMFKISEVVEALKSKWGEKRVEVLLKEFQKEPEYPVKQTISGMIFNPQLKLGNEDVLARADLRKKVLECKGNELLVEESEYQIVKSSFDQVGGFSFNDVEMCKRIKEAKTVEKVKEDKGGSKK